MDHWMFQKCRPHLRNPNHRATLCGRQTYGASLTTVRSVITAEKWATSTADGHTARLDYEGSPSLRRSRCKVSDHVKLLTSMTKRSGDPDGLPVRCVQDAIDRRSTDHTLAQPAAGRSAFIRQTESSNGRTCSAAIQNAGDPPLLPTTLQDRLDGATTIHRLKNIWRCDVATAGQCDAAVIRRNCVT